LTGSASAFGGSTFGGIGGGVLVADARAGGAATTAGIAVGLAVFGGAAWDGADLAGLVVFGSAAFAGFPLLAVVLRATGLAGADAFFFAGGADFVAVLETAVFRSAVRPAAAFRAVVAAGTALAPEALRAGFATALVAVFAARFGAALDAALRAAVVVFGFAAGLRVALARGLADRAALAAGFAVFFATAVRAGFAVRPLVRSLFDWAVAFITLPAVRAPWILRPWVFVAGIGAGLVGPGRTQRSPVERQVRPRTTSETRAISYPDTNI
jgi:hypothetical protein